MKLQIKQALTILAALKSLDSYEKQVGNTSARVPYSFNGKVRWNIAKNIGILERVDADTTKARDKIIQQASGGGNSIPSPDSVSEDQREKIQAQHTEFAKNLNELLNGEDEIAGLLKIKATDLNLDQNPIPPATLSILSPLIDDDIEQD